MKWLKLTWKEFLYIKSYRGGNVKEKVGMWKKNSWGCDMLNYQYQFLY